MLEGWINSTWETRGGFLEEMVFELDFEEWFSSYKEDRGRANQTEAWNMQRHGVLLIIFILILIPIPAVKPNTHIPFTEIYYELGAAPSSLL